MMIGNKWLILFTLLTTAFGCYAQPAGETVKEDMQSLFYAGTIVSVSDDVACYRLKGLKHGGMYGYCMLDSTYRPLISYETHVLTDGGEAIKILNSQCYTIIAPYFDYAQPFSEGWAAVCKNKKWSYVSKDGEFMCQFALDAAYPFKNGKAKVRYLGAEYIIDKCGNGLPLEICDRDSVEMLNDELVSLTVSQLIEETQYEKAIEIGNKCLATLLPAVSINDMPLHRVLPIIRLSFATNYGKSALLATTYMRQTPQLAEAFKTYKKITITQSFSYLADSPILNYYDCIEHHNQVKEDMIVNDIKDYIDRYDFKRAVLTLENTYKCHSKDTDFPEFRYLYHKLLALAGDFESVNRNSIILSETNDLQLASDYDKAIYMAELKQYATAIELLKSIIESHPQSLLQGKCYHHIALIYSDLGDSLNATTYFQKALSIYTAAHAPKELQLETMANLLTAHTNIDDSLQYRHLLHQYLDEEIKFNISLFSTSDSYNISKKWGLSQYRINKVISYICNNDITVCNADAYELTVFHKSVLQDAQTKWMQDAEHANDPTIQNMLAQYSNIRQDYTGYDIYDLDDDSTYTQLSHMFELERQIKNRLYHDIVTISVEKYNCWESVKNSLQADALAIEFFENNDVIAAWLIDKHSISPKYVEIIDRALFGEHTEHFLRNKSLSNIRSLYNTDLGGLLWNIPNIQSFQTIYFSPYGTLNEIGIEYLPCNGNVCISDVANVHRVTSTAKIAKRHAISDGHLVQLYGGLTYGKFLLSQSRSGVRTGYLKYSKVEVDEIEHILTGKCKVNKFVQQQGHKRAFIDNANSNPAIIHIATHGWQQRSRMADGTSFMYADRFNYYNQNTDMEDEDWLLHNSGLRMSYQDNVTDSLANTLYGSDIAKMKLHHTMLVVLSACNTAQGSVGDGFAVTLGLNYALQRAGVQNVISSLWNVDDAKTYEFMAAFYNNLVTDNNDIFSAFRATVLKMKQKYPKNPEIWAAFVLAEN